MFVTSCKSRQAKTFGLFELTLPVTLNNVLRVKFEVPDKDIKDFLLIKTKGITFLY